MDNNEQLDLYTKTRIQVNRAKEMIRTGNERLDKARQIYQQVESMNQENRDTLERAIRHLKAARRQKWLALIFMAIGVIAFLVRAFVYH